MALISSSVIRPLYVPIPPVLLVIAFLMDVNEEPFFAEVAKALWQLAQLEPFAVFEVSA